MTAVKFLSDAILNTIHSKKDKDIFEWLDIIQKARLIEQSGAEISDEEILNAAEDFSDSYMNRGVAMSSFARGCYWYREQVKSKK